MKRAVCAMTVSYTHLKCYLKLIYRLKKELPLLDEDHILGFDEIEVSKDDAKCKLAEKWMQKTAVDSELQVNENDTPVSYTHLLGYAARNWSCQYAIRIYRY